MKIIESGVYLDNLYLKELPEFLKDVVINGNFYCSDNNLTSLEGCPKEINGNFNCSDNKLSSLKHCPKEVKGNFYCFNNKLSSLKHCPKIVKGSFNCFNNSVKFTEEYVRSICTVSGNVYC